MNTVATTRRTHLNRALNSQFFKKGLTQSDAADLLGVEKAQVKTILDGREVMDDDFALKLALVFRKPPGYWLDLQKLSGVGEQYWGSKYAGDVLRGTINTFRLTVKQAAEKADIDVDDLNFIIEGKIKINSKTASRLKRAFGSKGRGWDKLGDDVKWKFH